MCSGVVNRLLLMIWENKETGENEETGGDDKAVEVFKYTGIKVSFKLTWNFGTPYATQKLGHRYSSYCELGSALYCGGTMVSLCTVQVY